MWNIPSEKNNKTGHPAVFPSELARDHIITWSKEGDTVLDPFLGSGTTVIEAIKAKRNYIGFEIPTMLDTTLSNIKSIATPFAFLILGGDLKFGNMFKNIKFSALSVLGKIVIIPAMMITLSAMLGFNQLEMAILIAVFATPNAVSSYAMARNYEADHELAGEIITLGTLLSIVTIFIFITISKTFGWISQL